MPIPSPNIGESRSNFMGRCIEFLIDEGKPTEQAVAICSNEWDKATKKEEAKKARIWKAFDNKRKAFESYATNVFHKGLKQSIRPYLDEVKRTQSLEVDLELMYNEEPIVEAYEKVYLKVMKPFALDTFNQFVEKRRKTGIDWEKLIRQWLTFNTTKKIVGVSNVTKKRVLKEIEQALIGGLSVDEFARRIINNPAFSMARARRIGRTEIIAGSNMGSLMGAKESGTSLKKKWLSSRDDRVRSHFKGNQWDHFQPESLQPLGLDEPFTLTSIEGKTNYLLVPSDDSLNADASNTINCRCTQIYVKPEESQESEVLQEESQIEDLATALAVSVGSVTNRKTFIDFVGQFGVRIERMPKNIVDNGYKEMAKQHKYLVDTLGEHPQTFKKIKSHTSRKKWGQASPSFNYKEGDRSLGYADGYVSLNALKTKNARTDQFFWEWEEMNVASSWNKGSSFMSTYLHEMVHHYDYTYSLKKSMKAVDGNFFKVSDIRSFNRLQLSQEIAEEMIELHGKEKFNEIAESLGRYVTNTFKRKGNWAELVTLAFEVHYSGRSTEHSDYIVKRFIEKYRGQK